MEWVPFLFWGLAMAINVQSTVVQSSKLPTACILSDNFQATRYHSLPMRPCLLIFCFMPLKQRTLWVCNESSYTCFEIKTSFSSVIWQSFFGEMLSMETICCSVTRHKKWIAENSMCSFFGTIKLVLSHMCVCVYIYIYIYIYIYLFAN